MNISKEQLQEWKKLETAATKGPWHWEVNPSTKTVDLRGWGKYGPEIIIDTVRSGMQRAIIRFNVNGLLTKAIDIADTEPSREHHKNWHKIINHPDANFIITAREAIPKLINEVERLQKENQEMKDRLFYEG